MYWEQPIETMERDALEALQLERFRQTARDAALSPFYGNLFSGIDFDPSTIASLADVRRIPPTTKENLRESWPYGFLAVPREKLVRMHSSSGTTGRATVIFHTADDLDAWTDILARAST